MSAKKDSAGMVGPAEPSTWWYTFDRAIPWLDARQQSQPPFHPAWRRYQKACGQDKSTEELPIRKLGKV
jgi:hypothetical protein